MREGYIPSHERKTILLLCDDIRMHSGIATMAREFVRGTAHRFNWVNLGGAQKHPSNGQQFDVSEDVATTTGVEDASVKIYAVTGYGTPAHVRELLVKENVDIILHFTDPRYWIWLYEIEREVRSKVPLVYLNIWDNFPAPMYNRSYYESCDGLLGISKQTVLINRLVLRDRIKDKHIQYVPHGINSEQFYPIEEGTDAGYDNMKQTIFKGEQKDFVVLWNSRNIRRKNPADVIHAYKQFCDMIGPEKSKRCALVMHTQPVDQNGTDLAAVRDAICDTEVVKIYFSSAVLGVTQMNWLYNLADVTVSMSSNEGWGLSLTESMMAGTMILSNVTGGMQDQMRFVDKEGEWYTPTAEVPSNHRGTYQECGPWALPVFPSNISITGSPSTPYIFDDKCSPESVASMLHWAYHTDRAYRKEQGRKGREWAMSDEAMMSSEWMSKNIITGIENTLEKFAPRKKFDILKIVPLESPRVEHSLKY